MTQGCWHHILTEPSEPFELSVSKDKRASMVGSKVVYAFSKCFCPEFFANELQDVELFGERRAVEEATLDESGADSLAYFFDCCWHRGSCLFIFIMPDKF